MTKNPLIMLKVLNWPLIMSPSDQFMEADVILIVMFQFLFCFLAQAATKYRNLALFYGVLNSEYGISKVFLVFRKPTLLFCAVDVD